MNFFRGGDLMYSKETLCKKITEVFPDIGTCGIDLTVDYDSSQKAWVVDLQKGGHHLRTFLDIPEADTCMEGKQCVSLGLQINQLRKNLGLIH